MFLPLNFLIGSISAITALAASDRSFFTSVELRDTVSGYDICTDPKHWFMIEAEMFISEGQSEAISLTIPEDFTSLPETPFHLLHKSVEVGQVINHENMLTVSFPTPPKENITATFNLLAKLSPDALKRLSKPLDIEYAFETSQNDRFKQLMHFQAKNLTQITVNGGMYVHNKTAWFTVDIPVEQLNQSIFITSESKAGSPKYMIDTTLTRCEMVYAVDAFHEPTVWTSFAPIEDKSSSASINMRFDKTPGGEGKYLRITYFTLPLVHRTVGSQVSFSKKRAAGILKRDLQGGLDLNVYANSYVNLYQREDNGENLATSSSAIYSNSSRPQSKSYSIPSSALLPSVSSTRTVPLSLSSGLSITFATSQDYTTELPVTSSVNTVSGSSITNSLVPSTSSANSTLEVSSSTVPPDTSTSVTTSPTSTLSGISSSGLPGKSFTSFPASNSSETLAPTSSSELPNESSQSTSSYSLVESASVLPSSLLSNTSSTLDSTTSALPTGNSEIFSVMPSSRSQQTSESTVLSVASSTASATHTSSILVNSTVSSMSATATSSSYQTYSVITSSENGEVTSFTSWFPIATESVPNNDTVPSAASYETYSVITSTENGQVTSFTSWFPVATESASSNVTTTSATSYETYSVITSTQGVQITSYTSWYPVSTLSKETSASVTSQSSAYETYSVITGTVDGQITSYTSWFPIATANTKTAATSSIDSYETYRIITSTENGEATSFTSWLPVATESALSDEATPSATSYETYSVITSTEDGQVTSFTSWFPVSTENVSTTIATPSATPYETYSVITGSENGEVTSFTSWFPVATESASSKEATLSATLYETYSVITSTENGQVTSFTSWLPVATESTSSNYTTPSVTSYETYSVITSIENGQVTSFTSWFPVATESAARNEVTLSATPSATPYETYSVITATENGEVTAFTSWFPIATEGTSNNIATSSKSCETNNAITSSQDGQITNCTSSYCISSQSITANPVSFSAEVQSTYSVFTTTENGQVSSGTTWFPVATEKSTADVLQTYAVSSSSQDERITSATLQSLRTKSKNDLATATSTEIFTTIGGNKTVIRTSLYPVTEKSTTTSAVTNNSTNTYSFSVTRTAIANTPSTPVSGISSTAETPLITQISSTTLRTSGVVSAAANHGTTLPLSSTTLVNWEPTATDYTISYQSSTARIVSRSGSFTTPVAKTSTIFNGTQAATATGEAELPCSCVQIVETLTRLPGGAWSTVGISQSPLPASTATPSGIVAKRDNITTKTTSDNRTSSIQTYQGIAMRPEMSLLSCVFGFLILIL
ncbi:EGT2 (YNL327W) [Zygosaccharomyces parabailii]|nr:EGT2 (YNL327W) [Zygosaccharomyces parabailii]CDH09500.1 uncharacterized protein ZBAI_01284 [Zygosaccharomyces bailii ISA1307]